MSRPWMPLYIADYLSNTGHLTAAEHGGYMLLIMHYWEKDGLPTDEAKLARIARMSPEEWQSCRSAIADFFDENWRHDRIEQEIGIFEAKRQERAEAGARGGRIAAENRRRLERNRSKTTSLATAEQYQPQPSSLSSSPTSSADSRKLEEEQACGRGPEQRHWQFDEFWKLYPHKIGKSAARREFERVRKAKSVDFTELIEALRRYVAKTDDRPWCNPATWLHQGRWEDQPAADERGKHEQKRTVQQAARDLHQRIADFGYGDPDSGGDEESGDVARLLSTG